MFAQQFLRIVQIKLRSPGTCFHTIRCEKKNKGETDTGGRQAAAEFLHQGEATDKSGKNSPAKQPVRRSRRWGYRIEKTERKLVLTKIDHGGDQSKTRKCH